MYYGTSMNKYKFEQIRINIKQEKTYVCQSGSFNA